MSRLFRPLATVSIFALVAATVVVGCSSDDPRKSPGDAAAGAGGGSAGGGGASGTGGTAGSSGSSGSAGTGGGAGMDGGAGTDGGAGAAGSDAGPSGPPALYPQNGANWNDYVKSDGTSVIDASDAACDSTTAGTGPNLCLHGGELRMFTMPAFSSCNNVTISDSLGAFDWMCDDSTGGVRAISTGLKTGKHLSDLIDWTASPPVWKDNAVSATDGTNSFNAPPSVWWENPVIENNTGGSLDTASGIYVVTSDAAASYVINADHEGFVAKPGLTLTNGPSTSAVLGAQDHPFLWIEGKVDAGRTSDGVKITGSPFSVVRGLDETGGGRGLYADASASSRFSDITATTNTGDGVTINGNDNVISNLHVDTSNTGILIQSADRTTLTNVTTRDNADKGLLLTQSADLVVKHVLSVSNGAMGVSAEHLDHAMLFDVTSLHNGLSTSSTQGLEIYFVDNSAFGDIVTAENVGAGVDVSHGVNDTYANVLTANNGYVGIYFGSSSPSEAVLGLTSVNNKGYGLIFESMSDDGTAMNALVANNDSYGVYVSSANRVHFHNLGSDNNVSWEVLMNITMDDTFSGMLEVPDVATSCGSSSSTNPGLQSGCTNQGTSTATDVTGSGSTGLIGKLASDDTTNPSDSNGSAAYGSITDWVGFDRPLRSWGVDGNPFPDPSNRGACKTGDNCRIWDFNLSSSDTTASRAVISAPADGNAAIVHTWYVASATGQADCAKIAGATWDATGSTCTSTLLQNAIEVLDDGVGNDNGLCESGETCLVASNLGAYQGHGALTSAGSIGAGGKVTNVTLMKYSTNGY